MLARRSFTIAISVPEGFVPHSIMLCLLDRGFRDPAGLESFGAPVPLLAVPREAGILGTLCIQ